MTEKVLDISWGTIGKLLLAAFSLYVIFQIKDVLVWTLFAVIISVLFDPAVDFLQRRLRLPRVVAALGIYLSVFGLLALLIYGTVPFFVSEIQRFSQLLPQYFETISPMLKGLGLRAFEDLQTFTGAVSGSLERMSSSIFSALFSVFGGIFATIFVISAAIFLSLEEKGIERAITLLFPKKHEAMALDIWARSQRRVSSWFLSRVLSSLFVAAATYLALVLFSVRYPVSLSLVSGVLNFIPVVGPLITGALVSLIVAVDNTLRAVFVLLSFVLIQQIENSVVMPLLSKKFIGLPPVLVLVALAIGGKLWGIMGAVLIVPLSGILFEFLRDFLRKQKETKAS